MYINSFSFLFFQSFSFSFFQTLSECFEGVCETHEFNKTVPHQTIAPNFRINLLCRDETFFVIEMIDEIGDYGNSSRYSKYKSRKEQLQRNLYMVKIQRGNVWKEKIFYVVSIPIRTFIKSTFLHNTFTYKYTSY